MKKNFVLYAFAFFAVALSLSLSSAVVMCPSESTVIQGTVYQNGDITDIVAGADVTVDCNGNLAYAVTGANGEYAVTYDVSECDFGDSATVDAVKDSMMGSEDGSVSMQIDSVCQAKLNVGIINVPLIPEFGLLIGSLTVISAVAVFFVVRRR
jgi:hypothetical protein